MFVTAPIEPIRDYFNSYINIKTLEELFLPNGKNSSLLKCYPEPYMYTLGACEEKT